MRLSIFKHWKAIIIAKLALVLLMPSTIAVSAEKPPSTASTEAPEVAATLRDMLIINSVWRSCNEQMFVPYGADTHHYFVDILPRRPHPVADVHQLSPRLWEPLFTVP